MMWQMRKVQKTKVHLENGWNSKRMITEGEAAIPLETTRRAFGNQQKSTIADIHSYLEHLVLF